MANYRKPKGTYNRPTADYFISQSAAAGVTIGGNFADTFYAGLYNNATDGSYLYVYGVCGLSQNANSTFAIYQQQGVGATLAQAGLPVLVNGKMIPGAIYTGVQNNWATMAQGFTWGRSFGGDSVFFPGFPLAIIPPTWMALILEQAATNGMIAGFYWTNLLAENV